MIVKYLQVLRQFVDLIDVDAWYECMGRIVPLLVYPWDSVRETAWRLIDRIAKRRTKRHVTACILPAISAISKAPRTFSRDVLLDPLPRSIFEEAIREQALDGDWLDNLDPSQPYTALLLLLSPWIMCSASYGVPARGKRVDERMLLLREVMGSSLDDLSLNDAEGGGDAGRGVPEIMSHLAGHVPTIGRIWQSWRLVPRLAKRLALNVKRIMVSPDRQWMAILSEGGELSYWDCRALLQVDQDTPVHVYEGEEGIVDVCFCESSFGMLVSFADNSLRIIKPSVQVTSRLEFFLETAHRFEGISENGNASQLHHFHTLHHSFVVFVDDCFVMHGFDLRSGGMQWSLELESEMRCRVFYNRSVAFIAYSDALIMVDLQLGLVRRRLGVQGITAMCVLPEPASQQVVNQLVALKVWIAIPQRIVLLNTESGQGEREIGIDDAVVQIVALPGALVVSREDGGIQVIDVNGDRHPLPSSWIAFFVVPNLLVGCKVTG